MLVRHAGGVEELRQLPPGFRFRPTDEELVVQYLRRKAIGVPLPAAVIPVFRDLYSRDPWDVVAVSAPGTSTRHHAMTPPTNIYRLCLSLLCWEGLGEKELKVQSFCSSSFALPVSSRYEERGGEILLRGAAGERRQEQRRWYW